MDEQYIARDLEIMASARNYNNWIYALIQPHAGKRIFEFGAGIGNYTERFVASERLIAVEINPYCFQKLTDRFGGRPHVDLVQKELQDLVKVEYFKDERIDTIVCLNVLEHIEDDISALRDLHRILVPGGHLILMVPCFQALYGEIDRMVGHYRRYASRELSDKINGAGFHIKKKFYMNSIGMIGWFLNSRLLKKTTQSAKQVLFYDNYIVPVLSRLERVIRPPFGQSLFAICEKR